MKKLPIKSDEESSLVAGAGLFMSLNTLIIKY